MSKAPKIGQKVRVKIEGLVDAPGDEMGRVRVRFPSPTGVFRSSRFALDELEIIPMPTLKERVLALKERPGSGVYNGNWIKADAVLDLLKEFGVEDA